MSSISTDWWIQSISIKSVFPIFIDSSIDKSIPIFIDWLLWDVYMCHAISFMSYDVSDSERFPISQEAMLFFLPQQQIFVFCLLSRIKFCFKSRRTLNVSQETLLGSFLWLDVSSNKYWKLAFFNFSLSGTPPALCSPGLPPPVPPPPLDWWNWIKCWTFIATQSFVKPPTQTFLGILHAFLPNWR